MFGYFAGDSFWHRLHPAPTLLLVGVWLVLSMLITHPLYLLLLLFTAAVALAAAGGFRLFVPYFRLAAIFTVVMLFFNAIVVRAGVTILFYGPRLPVVGKMNVSLEALSFAVVMGGRMLCLLLIFGFFNFVVNPDRLLGMLGKFAGNTGLFLVTASRIFPLLTADAARIGEVQRTRGLRSAGGPMSALRARVPDLSILLLSSLERSWQMAESMAARGYGSGRRSRYFCEFLRPRDWLVAVVSAVSLLLFMLNRSQLLFSFYPRLDSLFPVGKTPLLLFAGFWAVIALSWGWNRWSFFKSKI